ncbi:MAG: sulfatase, partial [Acidobacteriota bacterium]
IRDKNYENLKASLAKEPQAVQFIVRLEAGQKRKLIFQKRVRLPRPAEARTINFSLHRVDLPSPGQRALLTLMTLGDEGSFSFWYNPVVYTRRKSPRKVILISIDTLRPDHLGCYGYGRETSPNIDALARDSVLFERTYASSPWTLPSHVSLLTALHGLNHRVYWADERMDPSLLTLAEILRQSHYFCEAFTGSGFVSPSFGFSRGFDSYRGHEGHNIHENSAELTAGAVLDWLEGNSDKSFFLFIHTYQTHSPYACPTPYSTTFLKAGARWTGVDLMDYLGGKGGIFKRLAEDERGNIIDLYDGEILYLDEKLIKPLTEKLRELGIYDQTMIVLTSDHGEEFFEHGAWMHGQSLYEESLRVPLIIKFPRSKHRGRRVRSAVRLVDIMPTILEEQGISPEKLNLDGRSLIPVVRGKEKEDREFLADTDWLVGRQEPESEDSSPLVRLPGSVALGEKGNKLIINHEMTEKEARFFPSPPPRYPAEELYNLEKDAGETRDLTSQKRELARRMALKIREMYAKGRKIRPRRIEVTEQLREQLRALGYIR